jgi:hypothetical protein
MSTLLVINKASCGASPNPFLAGEAIKPCCTTCPNESGKFHYVIAI